MNHRCSLGRRGCEERRKSGIDRWCGELVSSKAGARIVSVEDPLLVGAEAIRIDENMLEQRDARRV